MNGRYLIKFGKKTKGDNTHTRERLYFACGQGYLFTSKIYLWKDSGPVWGTWVRRMRRTAVMSSQKRLARWFHDVKVDSQYHQKVAHSTIFLCFAQIRSTMYTTRMNSRLSPNVTCGFRRYFKFLSLPKQNEFGPRNSVSFEVLIVKSWALSMDFY